MILRRATRAFAVSNYIKGAVGFLVIVLLSVGAMWILSTDARREIDELAVASTDVSQWQISQTEVEYFALVNAIGAARMKETTLRQVRLRFDVFYSRIETNKVSEAFAGLRELPRVSEAIERIESRLDAAIPIIDAEDQILEAALPELAASLARLQPDLRAISLSGVQEFAKRSKDQRGQVNDALTDLGWISFGLLAMLLGAIGILLGIMRASDRQTAKIAITQSRLQSIITTSIDGVIVANEIGEVLDYNGAAERIFGYSKEEAIGADMATLIIPDHLLDAHNLGMKNYRASGTRNVIGSGLLQLEAKRKDGSLFPVELSVDSAISEEGEIFVAFLRDISKRVKNEKELVQARDTALAGEKAKADMLAVMSHEMRTPLNGVLGTIQLLSDTNLDEMQQKYIGVMEMSGKLLLEHVNDVLDISRFDAGAVEVAKQEFDVRALVRGVVEGLNGQAIERGNQLTINTIGRLPEAVMGDAPRVRQILFNLVGNAIKFTKNGVVTVEVESHEKDDLVEFRVIDTGIGIPDEEKSSIFSDFVTLDTSYDREVEGTGLGLGIVHRLVNALGGEINVESVVQEGSAFSVILPLPRASSDSAPFAKVESAFAIQGKHKILLVEDNEINRMVARDMLVSIGCGVTEASDGQQAVELANGQAFDTIFMDISMPNMDGITATKVIKASGGPNDATPIIALTAHALPDDVARFRAAGMVEVITKPLSFEALNSALGTHLSMQPNTREPFGIGQAAKLKAQAMAQLSEGLAQLERLSDTHEDREQISKLAHQLVGTAGVFELREVLKELQAIEDVAETASQEELKEMLISARSLLEVSEQNTQ